MAQLSEKDRERLRARAKHDPAPHVPGQAAVHPAETPGVGAKVRHFPRVLRGWADALFFAFLLAMFIRTYVFELFMIPTGSMTPTLIGDDARNISEYDWEGDGDEDIVVLSELRGGPLQVHLRDDDGTFGTLLYLTNPPADVRQRFLNIEKGKGRRDMIMVNKFAYWFKAPERGDIAVFKVPHRPPEFPFIPEKPVYIKRVVGLPGEKVEVQPLLPYITHDPSDSGRLTPRSEGGIEYIAVSQPVLINGKPITTPPFDRLHHFPPPMYRLLNPPQHGGAPSTWELGDDEVVMLGDNQTSSQDSRYWGTVPLSHLRGKAVLRYLPRRAFGLLDHGE